MTYDKATHNPASFAHEQGAALVALTDLPAYSKKLGELLQFVMDNYDDDNAVRTLATWIRCYYFSGPEMKLSNKSALDVRRSIALVYSEATQKYSDRVMQGDKPIYAYELP